MTYSFHESIWAHQAKQPDSDVDDETGKLPRKAILEMARGWELLGNAAADMWTISRIVDDRVDVCTPNASGPFDELTAEITLLNRKLRHAYGSLAFHCEQEHQHLRRRAGETEETTEPDQGELVGH